jgi:hypothetical protein
MPDIVIDAGLKEKLLAVGGPVILADESGRKLGRFVPDRTPDGLPALELTPEELARRLSPDCQTYTTQEVLAYCKGKV